MKPMVVFRLVLDLVDSVMVLVHALQFVQVLHVPWFYSMHTIQKVAHKADNGAKCAERANVSRWKLIPWLDDCFGIVSQDGKQGRGLMALSFVDLFPEHSSLKKISKIPVGFAA